MKFLRSLLLFTILTSVSSLDWAQDNNEFRWQGRIGAGKTVEIKGVNGEVRAEGSNSDDIEVVAVKRSTWKQGDADKVHIKLVEHADGITVCALYPQRDGGYDTCKPGSGGQSNYKNNTSVTFTVRVPRDVHFIGRTVNGSVNARGLGGNVQASTVNGGIDVATKGYAEASTVNGSITVACGRANWGDRLEFNTVNGSIEVALPETARTEINASTVNGRITTDLPLTIKGELNKRHLRGVLGGSNEANRQLRLNTVNGSITVKGGRGASDS
jgi:Putative adhesin